MKLFHCWKLTVPHSAFVRLALLISEGFDRRTTAATLMNEARQPVSLPASSDFFVSVSSCLSSICSSTFRRFEPVHVSGTSLVLDLEYINTQHNEFDDALFVC